MGRLGAPRRDREPDVGPRRARAGGLRTRSRRCRPPRLGPCRRTGRPPRRTRRRGAVAPTCPARRRHARRGRGPTRRWGGSLARGAGAERPRGTSGGRAGRAPATHLGGVGAGAQGRRGPPSAFRAESCVTRAGPVVRRPGAQRGGRRLAGAHPRCRSGRAPRAAPGGCADGLAAHPGARRRRRVPRRRAAPHGCWRGRRHPRRRHLRAARAIRTARAPRAARSGTRRLAATQRRGAPRRRERRVPGAGRGGGRGCSAPGPSCGSRTCSARWRKPCTV